MDCLGDALCGHIDDAEDATIEPIVSTSVGCSCIFLIGGSSREQVPVPLLLHSGDTIVMGGPSRMVFHGVPRIIENTLPEFLQATFQPDERFTTANGEDVKWQSYGHHLEQVHSRINLNVRQVFVGEPATASTNCPKSTQGDYVC
eukprot:c12785_g1_i7.p3 GENE.c12785_g1_i7~~c12785_g1_i7.p3  ORF type:complete len:145 (+),score=24.41 c12785_g1_i7:750-1184(+)